jgi:hypothetical protein
LKEARVSRKRRRRGRSRRPRMVSPGPREDSTLIVNVRAGRPWRRGCGIVAAARGVGQRALQHGRRRKRTPSLPESSCTPSSKLPRTSPSRLWTSALRSAGNSSDAYLEIANFARVAQTVHPTLTRGNTSILDRDRNRCRRDAAAGNSRRRTDPRCARTWITPKRAPSGRRGVRLDRACEAFVRDDRGYGDRLAAAAVRGESGNPRAIRQGFGLCPRERRGDHTAVRRSRGSRRLRSVCDTRGARESRAHDCAAGRDTVARGGLARGDVFLDCCGEQPTLGSRRAASDRSRRRLAHVSRRKARAYGSPALVPVAQSTQGRRSLYVDDARSRRMVVVTFGPDESNLASARVPRPDGQRDGPGVRREVHGSRPAGLTSFSKTAVSEWPWRFTDTPRVRRRRQSRSSAGSGFYVVDEGASETRSP